MMNVITKDKFPQKKISSFRVARVIKKETNKDLGFKKGEIFGSMCTTPPSFAKKILSKYVDVNLGDPGLFQGSSEIEESAIKIVSNLLHGPNGVGTFVTGGTEANIIAIQCALLNFLHSFIDKGLTPPQRAELELLVPESAHFSFNKAATLLGVKLKKIGLNSSYQVDTSKLEEAITANTFAIVAIAGTTGLGTIDDIKTISEIAKKHNLFLHIDAAFGGFVIPFMEEQFKSDNQFDFSLDGVSSITVDPHKMGQGVTPGGIILFKDKELTNHLRIDVDYLSGGKTSQLTIVGTRNGGAVLACYSSLLNLGYDGYKKIVKRVFDVRDYFLKELSRLSSYKLVANPTINVVGIYSTKIATNKLAKLLREKNIAVSTFSNFIRIVIMPQIKKRHIKAFVKQLKEIEENYE